MQWADILNVAAQTKSQTTELKQWPELFHSKKQPSFKRAFKAPHLATEQKVTGHVRRQTAAPGPLTCSWKNPAPKPRLGYKAGHSGK